MRHEDVSTWSAPRIEADLRETNATIRQALPEASIPYYRARGTGEAPHRHNFGEVVAVVGATTGSTSIGMAFEGDESFDMLRESHRALSASQNADRIDAGQHAESVHLPENLPRNR
jgi:hypothetical protein